MSDDKQVQKAVLDELSWEPSVNSAHIGVTARSGVVTLTGRVKSLAEKWAAEKATRRVKDVKAVAEEIEVVLPAEMKLDDEVIAAAVVTSLKWDSSVPQDTIIAKVERGLITLTGEVDWHYQKEAAEADVRSLRGVLSVFNEITIKPKGTTSTIKDDIKTALGRCWFDSSTIKVTVHGGDVKLKGTVDALCKRDAATAAAWAAPGTTSVDNELIVI
jgi:osmotically-inducible protein OsmY